MKGNGSEMGRKSIGVLTLLDIEWLTIYIDFLLPILIVSGKKYASINVKE